MKKVTKIITILSMCLLGSSTSMGAQSEVAHHITDEFSLQQGNISDANQGNNWLYQFIDKGTSDFADVTEISEKDHKGWSSPVQINAEGGMHPSADKNAVLTWVSTYEGGTKIRIAGEGSKFDSNKGDGTLLSIYKNDELIMGPKLVSTMETPVLMAVDEVTVSTSDAIRFVVDCNGNDTTSHYFDYTRWAPTIYVQENIPEGLHRSSKEYASEQGNLVDSSQANDWLYQYKYNVSDDLLPSDGFEADSSKIFNLEAFWDNVSYTALGNKSVRQEDVNSRLWSTAMLTRAWMGQGHNVFVGPTIMQPSYGYDAVKTWVNTDHTPKQIQIKGAISLISPELDPEGVQILIMKEDTLLYNETLKGQSVLQYDIPTTLLTGEKIYFLVHQKSTRGQGEKDFTTRNRVSWDPSISVADTTISNPEPPLETPFNMPMPQLEGNVYSYQPSDNGEALNNPGMGLHFAYYDNFLQHYGDGTATSDTLDYFEGMNVLYIRVPWSFVEPIEGQYDWNKIDELIGYWMDKGKKIGFRFTSQELEEQAAPLWLKAKGAGGYLRNGTFSKLWVPHASDQIFRKKYKDLLEEVARKYGDNEAVEFIEMGALGVWGEGHGGYSISDFKAFGDMFREIFPTKILLWPDDSGSNVYSNAEVTEGFGLYDDSIGYANQMGNIAAANKFWRQKQVRVEMTHYYEAGARPFFMNTPEKMLQSIENIHGSYFLIHGYPDRFWDERADIIRRINRRIGYRLNVESISWPKTVARGITTSVNVQLRNAGVAPNYKGGYVSVTLIDENGNSVASGTETSFNTKNLVVKENQRDKTSFTEDEVSVVDVPITLNSDIPLGEYTIYLSIGDRDGNPIYELPYASDRLDKLYPMGTIHIKDNVKRYEVNLATDIQKGSVSTSVTTALEGEMVIVTAVPQAGYVLSELLVNGESVEGNAFSMPGEDVTITAVFRRKAHRYSQEYGSTQGDVDDDSYENNWLYQYVAYTDAQSYTPSVANIEQMVYENNKWIRQGGNYPSIDGITLHPDNGYDSVITWVNPYQGDEISSIQIKTSAQKFDNKGDGVQLTVLKNNEVIWGPSEILDTTMINGDIETTIAEGDKLHFIMNQNGPLVGAPSSDETSRWFDAVNFDVIIQPE